MDDEKKEFAALSRMMMQRISSARNVPGSGTFQNGYKAGLDLAANIIKTMLGQQEQKVEDDSHLKW
jgi:hypothetical protein